MTKNKSKEYKLSRLESAKEALNSMLNLINKRKLTPILVKTTLHNLANGIELLLKEYLFRKNPLYIYKDLPFPYWIKIIENTHIPNKPSKIEEHIITISGKEAVNRASYFEKLVKENMYYLNSLFKLRNMVEHNEFTICEDEFKLVLYRGIYFVSKFLTEVFNFSLYDFFGKNWPIKKWEEHQLRIWKEELNKIIKEYKNKWNKLSKKEQQKIMKIIKQPELGEFDKEYTCPSCGNIAILRGKIEMNIDYDPYEMVEIDNYPYCHVYKLECPYCGLIIENEDLLYALLGELDFDIDWNSYYDEF